MTSWAFEMEILILGWYVIVETQSVLSLTLFASLQWLGTLLAPYLGALGDRLSRRTLLCSLRLIYLVLSLALMTLALTQSLEPTHVYVVSLLAGLVRPSDLVMRNGLIGDTISDSKLMSFSLFGLGAAYIMISLFYAISFLLTLGVSGIKTNPMELNGKIQDSVFFNLKQGLIYVWRTPTLLAAMWLAFLVNLTVFPVSHGILPYVAKVFIKLTKVGLAT